MILTLILVAIVTVLLVKLWYRRPDNFPPGPPYFPIIGSAASLFSSGPQPLYVSMMKLSEKYGPLVGLFLGPVNCVGVNGFDAVKQVLTREDCSFRPDGILFRKRAFNKRLGVLFSDGPRWKTQRRFTLRHLRDFGFGKRSMEGLIHEEIETLLEKMERRLKDEATHNATTGMDVLDLFPVSVINILWAIMAGVRYDHENAHFKALMFNVNEFFRNGNPTGGIMLAPFLRFIPIINAPYKRQLKSVFALQEFMRKTITEHEETYQDDNMRDFIDIYLREMKATPENEETTFDEEQLIVLLMDLFLAGTETTSSSLGFMVMYMVKHPEAQERLRQEVHLVVGRDRLPTNEDMPKLPYTQAFMSEVLRLGAVLPFTLPHLTKSSIELMGYTIPKYTLLLVNLWSVFAESEHWRDPEAFRPERFLDKQGRFFKDDHLLLFGLGPRVCLGEPLARNSGFLFLTAIVQRFSFSIPSSCPSPSMEHLQGFTTSPRPFKVTVREI